MTIAIIIITSVFSFIAFNNSNLFIKFRYNPYLVKHNRELYRTLTHGFLHADWTHLLVNMFVLFSFGSMVEKFYYMTFGAKGYLYFILLYVFGILFSVVSSYKKYKDNSSYNAVGASGAVAAVLFSSIIFYPMGKIYMLFIPIGIPSVIFGVIYLVYSAYMDKKAVDNIGHDAHFYGALFGALFTILLKPTLLVRFFDQIINSL